MSARLLIVPGLHDSGPLHWQSWLQRGWPGALRVVQSRWHEPDLDRWAARIGATLDAAGTGPWLAVAHSYGCLALVHHLRQRPGSSVHAALLVAPADPARFGVAQRLPVHPLARATTLVGSTTDPWMAAGEAEAWATRWGSHWIDLGDAGHINVESGFGPWPFARRWVQGMSQRLERTRRPRRAAFFEWSFAV